MSAHETLGLPRFPQSPPGASRMAHLRAVAAYLAGGDITAEITALLRRWTGRRRPAVLVVLDWDTPFADVYAEDELLGVFPDAPLIPAGPIDGIGPGRLLIVVIDEQGETAHAIADPRASN